MSFVYDDAIPSLDSIWVTAADQAKTKTRRRECLRLSVESARVNKELAQMFVDGMNDISSTKMPPTTIEIQSLVSEKRDREPSKSFGKFFISNTTQQRK